ncbi:MAG: glucose-1-phosphate adenylyltransferase subunit GlgD [Clostridia bacterium]|nr:glucose-1-phosphate adenylyltransferase subunit GlgD [Clostridia bacterium]
MKKDVMGLIYTGERDAQLRELTDMRAVAAVPLCGRYRLIDFPLSAMTGSGISNIGVITQRNYHSLMDHLGSGKEWDLHGKRSGLHILPPFMTNDNVGMYSGFLDALRSNTDYLKRSKEKYVVITDTHMLFSVRYDDMVDAHVKSGADITLLYTTDASLRAQGPGRFIQVEEDQTVSAIEVDPTLPRLNCQYLEAFCVEREKLIDLVDSSVSRGQYHLTRDLLMSGINNKTLKVCGYECKSKVWHLDSVQAYFNCNMDLLNPEYRKSLFSADRPVWTKVRDEMPSRYTPEAKVQNSLIADGCVIEGTVENCVLFRGVHIGKGAKIKDCIIMQDSYIEDGVEMENVILDKNVTVRAHGRLMSKREYPIVIGKNVTL